MVVIAMRIATQYAMIDFEDYSIEFGGALGCLLADDFDKSPSPKVSLR